MFKITTIQLTNELFKEVPELITQVLRTPFGCAPYAIWPDDDKYTNIVAYKGKELVGCLLIWFQGKVVQWVQMAVKETMQGQGVGSKLAKFAEKLCKQKGAKEIFLHARIPSVSFYEQNGFTCLEKPFINRVGGVYIPFIKMTKML